MVTDRVSVCLRPSALDATTVTDQRPLASSNGPLNAPSAPTGKVSGAGVVGGLAVGGAVLPGFGVGVGPPAVPRYVALTTTWVAFVVLPAIGMAPFWKLAPSAGESHWRVGARTAEIGTLTMYASVWSEFLPVSGSVAEILKSLRPRRRGTIW